MSPPRVGPIAGPAMTTAPKSPCALACSSFGKVSNKIDCALASSPPPKRPCSTRATTTMGRLPASPQSTEAAVKATSEKTNFAVPTCARAPAARARASSTSAPTSLVCASRADASCTRLCACADDAFSPASRAFARSTRARRVGRGLRLLERSLRQRPRAEERPRPLELARRLPLRRLGRVDLRPGLGDLLDRRRRPHRRPLQRRLRRRLTPHRAPLGHPRLGLGRRRVRLGHPQVRLGLREPRLQRPPAPQSTRSLRALPPRRASSPCFRCP